MCGPPWVWGDDGAQAGWELEARREEAGVGSGGKSRGAVVGRMPRLLGGCGGLVKAQREVRHRDDAVNGRVGGREHGAGRYCDIDATGGLGVVEPGLDGGILRRGLAVARGVFRGVVRAMPVGVAMAYVEADELAVAVCQGKTGQQSEHEHQDDQSHEGSVGGVGGKSRNCLAVDHWAGDQWVGSGRRPMVTRWPRAQPEQPHGPGAEAMPRMLRAEGR